jgi:RNA polymerase sigma-70 factor (ECF subfamily)
MAFARPLEGVDGDAAECAAVVSVRFPMAGAWGDLRDQLLSVVTDPTAEGGQPDPPRSPRPQFEGDDADRVEALVELAQGGDAEAFGQLYERSVDVVYRYVYVRTGDRHLSEDITSETFLKAMRNIGSFRWQGRDIAAWFITIARNLVIDHGKSAHFRLEITTDELLDRPMQEGTPEDEVLRRHRDVELVDALRGLTSDQAECVVLRYMEGLSVAECAIVLGRKENAVKQLQLRAIRALRKDLDRAG